MSQTRPSSGLHWIIATGIVGADIGTSVFYGTGILFPIVGYWAPFFILLVCFMMWFFKRTYEEGLALSPYNGGSYSMVLRSLGRRVAVLIGAMTVLSYLATATVSSLSGAYYFSTLWESSFDSSTIVLMAFFPLVFFGILNSRGIKEPAKLVTVITALHFALLTIMALWGLFYLAFHYEAIDFTRLQNLQLRKEFTLGLFVYGVAAAFLGITGFESAAQIVEELQAPALLTVKRLYKAVILLVSFTAPLISFLCLMILTKNEVNQNLDSLLSALAHKLGGRGFVTVIVVDATLTLFAATNTAFVGFIGLATTMAKQGNLPLFLLSRFQHHFPSVKGYPFIALPFMLIAMLMTAFVTGEIEVVAKVYEISFIFVMVSFCIGVILMRNRKIRNNIQTEYLSTWILKIKNKKIPIIPLASALVLLTANVVLFLNSSNQVHLMLLFLLSFTLLIMIYYRWGVLEKRLETHSDLRLGLGVYSRVMDLPHDLKKYVLCAGGVNVRRLINQCIEVLLKREEKFELIIFHAEDSPEEEKESFFFELLQRVISQQIAPLYEKRGDFILTVKVLPGGLEEGLQGLKKITHIERIFLGVGRTLEGTQKASQSISSEIQIETEIIER